MSQLSSTIRQWFTAHHGVASAAELGALGIGRTARQRLVRVGVLCRVERGVYVLVGAPTTLEQRCRIQLAAHPTGYVTGPTAGMLAGLRRMPPSSAVHLTVRHGVHLPAVSGVRYRQTRAFSTHDRVVRPDGIAVATWPRLAFDLAADLRVLDHTSVVHQMLDRRLVTRPELIAIGTRLVHPTRPGSATFERTISNLGDGRAHQSHPEVRLADELRARGIPVERQTPVAADGRVIHLDLAVPALQWGVELDIHPEHRTEEGQQGDAIRRHVVNCAGWTQETFTALDLEDWPAAVARIVAGYRLACTRHHSPAS